MLVIHQFDSGLTHKYREIESVLYDILGDDVTISHVGSSALGISGKNIIDVLIGVPRESDLRIAADRLVKAGYFEGKETGEDRIFLASRPSETRAGDAHLHICVEDSPTYENFLILRDYLLAYPDELVKYENQKRECAMLANGDRQEYRRLKSLYLTQAINRARMSIASDVLDY